MRYTKADVRPSTEILKLKHGRFDSRAPAAASGRACADRAGGRGCAAPTSAGLPDWAFPLAGFVLLGVLGAAVILWWWRRERGPVAPAPPLCAKCGAAQAPGNRFCGNCGAKIV